MQQQADQPTHQRAVEADELQVAAHAQFQLFDQMALVPALHGLRDMRGHTLAQAAGQALRTFQQVLVEGLAQGRVRLQAGAQRGEAALQVPDRLACSMAQSASSCCLGCTSRMRLISISSAASAGA